MLKERFAIFISGKGSNLKALIDSHPRAHFYVYANKNCQGLTWAKRRGLCTQIVELKNQDQWVQLAQELKVLKFSKVFLLGFMKIIPEVFISQLGISIVNLHPSALPLFPGLKSIEKSFEAQKGMGCTLHYVVPEVDAGEIILQKKMKAPSELSAFEERVHQFEQNLVKKYFDLSRRCYG